MFFIQFLNFISWCIPHVPALLNNTMFFWFALYFENKILVYCNNFLNCKDSLPNGKHIKQRENVLDKFTRAMLNKCIILQHWPWKTITRHGIKLFPEKCVNKCQLLNVKSLLLLTPFLWILVYFPVNYLFVVWSCLPETCCSLIFYWWTMWPCISYYWIFNR